MSDSFLLFASIVFRSISLATCKNKDSLPVVFSTLTFTILGDIVGNTVAVAPPI